MPADKKKKKKHWASLLHIYDGGMHKIPSFVFIASPWCCQPWCAHPARCVPGTTTRQGFPTSLLPAWAALEHSDGVTWDFLSHHGVGWALPVSCKESFTLKLLLACVLLSKHVVGPCFVAVLLCWINSFLAWCVREWWLTADTKTRFSCVQRSLFRGEWALMGQQDQFSRFLSIIFVFSYICGNSSFQKSFYFGG